MKKIMILGSTGSIGMNALSIVKNHLDVFKVVALTANNNVTMMLHQCELFQPDWVAMQDKKSSGILKDKLKSKNIKTHVLSGSKSICELAALKEVDYVIAAIVGMAGLFPLLSAIKSSKIILLANKESLVTCGYLLMKELSSSGSKIIPIDSEHNAIFQVLPEITQKNLGRINLKQHCIKSIILTGSGGPFYHLPLSDLSSVTPEQACTHPNWAMGKKISVDSATMMNKGLEYAEARWLFNASDQEMKILIHPQSIIHSMVEHYDGSILAQLSVPDIQIAIGHALFWPLRLHRNDNFLNFSKMQDLSFIEPNFTQFPCLKLAIDAFSQGQSAMTALNAANEVSVSAFLDLKIRFTDIIKINTEVLMSSCFSNPRSIEDILEIDRKSRVLANKKVLSFLMS